MTNRELFLRHLAQTSDAPLCFEVSRAEGCYLYDEQDRPYIDLIGGISVCNVGHGHAKVREAIHRQTDHYLHVMVYGEVIQSPQVKYAKALSQYLPGQLDTIYFTNSGSEATEGAMKLAKRVTGRSKMIYFRNSYHGSTQGALSLMGSEYWQQAYRPLLPDTYCYDYHAGEAVEAIDKHTACVVMEVVQAEAGVLIADNAWLKAIETRCRETGTLLIVDEIQTGFGRTGSMFRFSETGIMPDIVLLGKALGGGLPMGAFIAAKSLMQTLSIDPVLGHITTFGGHPLCCAAGHAALEVLIDEQLIEQVKAKEQLFREKLVHPAIRKVNSCGLLIAVHFEHFETNKRVLETCLRNGIFSDWFLFASNAMRIAPPLSINTRQIEEACAILIRSIDEAGVS